MEKKVALIWLFVIMLGFWSVTMLFFMGNPFAQTEGSYHYGISDVTVQIPLNWLDKLLPALNGKSSSASAVFIQRIAQNQTCSECVSGNYIYVHLGNVTVDLKGKNWELFVTRIGYTIGSFIVATNLSHPIQLNLPEVQSNPLIINTTALGLLVLGLLIGYCLVFVPRIYLRIRRRKS